MRERLTLHPDSLCPPVSRIEVDVVRRAKMLELRYVVTGDIEALLVPPPAPAARADELWRHTCFEAFVGGAQTYVEFNFSPSTAWAAYRFDAYRSRMRDAHVDSPRITASRAPDRFELSAAVALPEEGRLGLSAVIEEKNGRKSWWALAHPPGKPDFHHRDCFALQLPSSE